MTGRGRRSGTGRALGRWQRIRVGERSMHESQMVSAIWDAIESVKELPERSRGESRDERLLCSVLGCEFGACEELLSVID